MSLANLFNIPHSEEDLQVFSFSNMDQHRQIVDAVTKQRLTLYPLDPIPTQDARTWLMIHQQAHVEFTSALGIAGVDLTAVDFHDPEQMASWIRLHADEHMQAANKLGLR
jgi:hypothetical protein